VIYPNLIDNSIRNFPYIFFIEKKKEELKESTNRSLLFIVIWWPKRNWFHQMIGLLCYPWFVVSLLASW